MDEFGGLFNFSSVILVVYSHHFYRRHVCAECHVDAVHERRVLSNVLCRLLMAHLDSRVKLGSVRHCTYNVVSSATTAFLIISIRMLHLWEMRYYFLTWGHLLDCAIVGSMFIIISN